MNVRCSSPCPVGPAGLRRDMAGDALSARGVGPVVASENAATGAFACLFLPRLGALRPWIKTGRAVTELNGATERIHRGLVNGGK